MGALQSWFINALETLLDCWISSCLFVDLECTIFALFALTLPGGTGHGGVIGFFFILSSVLVVISIGVFGLRRLQLKDNYDPQTSLHHRLPLIQPGESLWETRMTVPCAGRCGCPGDPAQQPFISVNAARSTVSLSPWYLMVRSFQLANKPGITRWNSPPGKGLL
jgi:hypothetical protein